MNKDDFARRLAQRGYTKTDAKQITNDVLDTITECLLDGQEVNFHGFGSFRVINARPRETVNMHTGERVVVAGHAAPKFAAGQELRRVIKDGGRK